MFKNQKILTEIMLEKERLQKEKNELLFIKGQLEDTSPKIDMSDIYVWRDDGIYSIVKLDVKNISGRTFGGLGKMAYGYESTLTDIFTGKIVYQKSSTKLIGNKEFICDTTGTESHYAYCYHLYYADKNLLAYIDKKVPLYVLQQLYYRLNQVDVDAKILKKEK